MRTLIARRPAALALVGVLVMTAPVAAQVLDAQTLLERQTFWDNRDWDWYRGNIPLFESPDPDLDATWYYRWELVTKHLTYGSPNTGYTFTEFIDRPFWSGTYGAISCPAGHQLYEVRWLKDPRYARDYARYWFRTPGAQPRRYSTWLADAVWAAHQVHPDDRFVTGLLPDLVENYRGWEREHFVPEVGLFWQTGHDDGMEYNINSRQTQDLIRGAPGYRPTLNSYLWADAQAIARVARLAGDEKTARAYEAKADALKRNLQEKLWDPRRGFYFPMAMRDEERDGHTVRAGSLTYQTGRFAGSPRGRELIGYVPWQFGLPDPGRAEGWRLLMDRDGFFADYGPTSVERRDPMFHLSETCCWWSGQSWPYATTQTLKGMANLLQDYEQTAVTRADYLTLLRIYARAHRKGDAPYLAEACHPDTGSWEGHDAYNHSEHYFHSGYCDLIVTGLVGLRPRDDETIEVHPLAPESWDYFALDDLPYRGRRVSVVWDRAGARYGLGAGLHLLADGRKLASAERLGPLTAKLPPGKMEPTEAETKRVNYAVNNDGHYYPRVTASFVHPKAPLAKVNDGNYWYHVSPPNRWTCEGSPNDADWCVVDFGLPRLVDTVALYPLDDGTGITPPRAIEIEAWDGTDWVRVPDQTRSPTEPAGRRANTIRFPARQTQKIRVTLTHRPGSRAGLSELEVWGDARLPIEPAPPPAGNLVANPRGEGFPKASASHTSRFDKVEMVNDGLIHYTPGPHNRWTSYESPNETDWLTIDFGAERTVGRLVLHVYDDGGGVQPPAGYVVQYLDGDAWRDAAGQVREPAEPAGGTANTVTFEPVRASRIRVLFEHRGKSRSGLTELEAWRE